MKKFFPAIVVLVVVVIIGFLVRKEEPADTLVPTVAREDQSKQCFVYDAMPSVDAPYEIHERIELSFEGDAVEGVKSGVQAGPDMTNGYEGTLSGTKEGDTLALVFLYTIEGSSQSERERYTLADSVLIKKRYPLLEKDGVLVPDTTKSAAGQVYQKISC